MVLQGLQHFIGTLRGLVGRTHLLRRLIPRLEQLFNLPVSSFLQSSLSILLGAHFLLKLFEVVLLNDLSLVEFGCLNCMDLIHFVSLTFILLWHVGPFCFLTAELDVLLEGFFTESPQTVWALKIRELFGSVDDVHLLKLRFQFLFSRLQRLVQIFKAFGGERLAHPLLLERWPEVVVLLVWLCIQNSDSHNSAALLIVELLALAEAALRVQIC